MDSLLGGLGWVVNSEGLTMNDLKQGGVAMAILASSAFDMSPSHALYTQPVAVEHTAVAVESTPSEMMSTDLQFTELPVFPPRMPNGSSTESALYAEFSDEVEITVDEDGSTLVRPIFRDGTQEGARFLLVPINESTN